MTTKHAEPGSPPKRRRMKVIPAYWLEYHGRIRATKLSHGPERPLRMAGRALENVGSLDGWALVRRDADGTRHVIATDDELETMARPQMPKRTAEEAAHLKRHLRIIRASGFREPHEDMDRRVY